MRDRCGCRGGLCGGQGGLRDYDNRCRRCAPWSLSWGRCFRSWCWFCHLHLGNVLGYVERLEGRLELDGACRQDCLGSGRGSGLTDGRAKGDSGGRGSGGRLGRRWARCRCLTCWGGPVLSADHSTTWQALLQRGLEDTGVLVEGELALELVLHRGGDACIVKLDGRSVQGESFKLRVKVEGARCLLCRLSRLDWPGGDPNRTTCGCGTLRCRGRGGVSDGQKVLQGVALAASLAKVGESVSRCRCSCGTRTSCWPFSSLG